MEFEIPVSSVKLFVPDKSRAVDVLNEDVFLSADWRRPMVRTNHVNLGHISKRLRFD
jgi:hypothetical protein